MSASDSLGEEFREIGNCGGKIELIRNEQGMVSMRVSGTGPMRYSQMGISLDGNRMEYWPILGVDQRPVEKPSSMVPAFLPADNTGLSGRSCPNCKAYFRTDGIQEYMFCPYCNCRAPAAAFTTENQRAFLNRQRELWITAFQGGENVTIDLNSSASELPQNRPPWTPKEEQQQFHFVCEKCKKASDILGEYASCPACGYRNSLGVLERHLVALDNEFNRAVAGIQDRAERETAWASLLTRFVSAFEAMATDIQGQLVQLPMTVKRRKEVEKLSFQRITEAEEKLRNWFGIEIFNGLKQEDKEFLNREFNRRHLLTHRAGRVDEEYLRKTGDTSVKLHQTIRIRSADIARLSKLLHQCASNLFDQFSNIS
jgi:DNA-directed RNA polymerase subunit RPC12/RpoP